MGDGAHYRQKARTFEQRENWKRAIEAYELAVQADREARKEPDLALFNRIGDLYRRIGDVNKAVLYYEMAADGHLAAGFYNNAIALCNKILRNQPNRHSAYLKLGKIGAAKGFLSDARRHFLEYAGRMQKAGQLDEAFRALIEFADLSPDPEVRLMIADQLIEHNLTPQAVDQMRLAWRDLRQEGREADAQEVRDRIVEMAPDRDPEVDPPDADSTSYVGLDAEGVLELPEILPWDDEPVDADAELEAATIEPVDVEGPVADLEPALGEVPELEPAGTDAGLELVDREEAAFELEPVDLDSVEVGLPGEGGLAAEDLEIEPTSLVDEGAGTDVSGALGLSEVELEPTALDEPVPEPTLEDLEDAFAADPLPTLETAPAPPVAKAPPTPAERIAVIESRMASEGKQPGLLVELAEALLETGGREKATFCLSEAAELYEQQGDAGGAGRVVDELLRLDVNDVRAYQKRVELCLRAGDRAGLVEAYLGLADCLDRTDAGNKARAVYARVLELDPGNGRAAAALEMFGAEPSAAEPVVAGAGQEAPGSEYIDLGSLVVEEEKREKSTRFRIPAADPQSEADVNFSEMLKQFKSKVAENIEEEDASSHYDLGVAFKEMGLIDEAIAEFQIAARGAEYRLRAIEMLGACFLEKEDFRIALKVLGRALQVPDYRDEELVGIFYAMGRAYESLGERPTAVEWYERVLGCDVGFKDVSQRVASLRG